MIKEIKQKDGFIEIKLKIDPRQHPLDPNVFENHVRPFIDSGKVNFLFDFESVESFTSNHFGRLIWLYNNIKKDNGRLHLINVGETVGNLIDILNLSMVFRIFKTKEDAINAF